MRLAYCKSIQRVVVVDFDFPSRLRSWFVVSSSLISVVLPFLTPSFNMGYFNRVRDEQALDPPQQEPVEYTPVQLKELEARYPDGDDEHVDRGEEEEEDDDDLDLDAEDFDTEKQNTLLPTPRWKRFTTYNSQFKSHIIAALPRYCQPGGLKNKRKLHATSYLDALRGYAAWIVFMFHTFNTYDPSWRLQPFVSIIFAGNGMVALFFVISGYVLSYRLLQHIRNRAAVPVLESLVSSLFRRYLRLYGSCVLSLVIVFIMVRLRLYDGSGELYIPSFFGQLGDFCLNTFFFINPFAEVKGYFTNEVFVSKYLGPMWTIPVEFRGSVIIFVFLAAVCKLSTRSRMLLTWVIIIASYGWTDVYVAEFFLGMFVADLSLGRNPDRLKKASNVPADSLPSHSQEMPLSGASPSSPSSSSPTAQTIPSKIFYSLLFVLAIFILGQPDQTDLGVWGPFPWAFLKSWIPWYYNFSAGIFFYLSMGSFFLILSLDSYRTLQLPLEWGFSQYVGELSFGIYALHPPLAFCFYRDWAEPLREKYLGASPWAYLPGFIAMTLLVFTAADYFNRLDGKVVKFGRWLQSKMFRW